MPSQQPLHVQHTGPVLLPIPGRTQPPIRGAFGRQPELSQPQQAQRHPLDLAGDAEALANLTAYLATKKKPYRLRLQEEGQLNELKEGPAVLIGAFSNSFTLRLTGPTRFNFVRLIPIRLESATGRIRRTWRGSGRRTSITRM